MSPGEKLNFSICVWGGESVESESGQEIYQDQDDRPFALIYPFT
jgi:hypothetical protein